MKHFRNWTYRVALWTANLTFACTEICFAQAPTPEVVSLQTRDGVQLKLTYYPSTQPKGSPVAKQVAPVVLLHDYKETRNVFASFARRLQAPGEGEPSRPSFAAVTVDLRAHGESTKQVYPDGSQIDLDAAKLNKNGLLAMASLDMEAVRGFLMLKNDAGELNLNKLSLIGAGMGANVAANWAEQDWSAPPLAVGKQGQDVKSLVLLSPQWTFKGLSLQTPLRHRPLREIAAWMLVYGNEDSKLKADATRIARQLQPPRRSDDDAESLASGRVTIVDWPSKLQGATLLTKIGPPVEDQMLKFLVENVALVQHPWFSRLDRLP